MSELAMLLRNLYDGKVAVFKDKWFRRYVGVPKISDLYQTSFPIAKVPDDRCKGNED